MKTSTQDKAEGTLKSAMGSVKEKIGHATRDPRMQDEGTAQKLEGQVQKKVGDIKKVFNR